MGKTNNTNRRYFKYIAMVLLVVFLISGGLFGIKLWEKHQGNKPSSDVDFEEDTVYYNDKEYVLNKDIETFLVLGLDKVQGSSQADSYNNNKQADFLMLFVFDKKEKSYHTIHINRDTMANVNVLGVAGNTIDTVQKQIALAHTYGNGKDVSCRNTANAVSDLLQGVKINHYASFTMDSVAVFNDLVGGVEVTVQDDFTGIDDTLIKGEKVTLMGQHALNYVRTRYGLDDSTNSTRMNRQQQYLNALLEKTHQRAAEDDGFIVEASIKMSDYIVSDRSVTQLQELGNRLESYEFKGIRSFTGKNEQGEEFIEFYPDEESVIETVIELFYKQKN